MGGAVGLRGGKGKRPDSSSSMERRHPPIEKRRFTEINKRKQLDELQWGSLGSRAEE